MKLSKQTIEILKNFSSINMSVVLKPGSKIRTVSPQKTILAQAIVSETFPKECAIYDLNIFINTAAMFEDPDFNFNENSVEIKNGPAFGRVPYASISTIATPPEKDIVLPSVDVTFTERAITSSGSNPISASINIRCVQSLLKNSSTR